MTLAATSRSGLAATNRRPPRPAHRQPGPEWSTNAGPAFTSRASRPSTTGNVPARSEAGAFPTSPEGERLATLANSHPAVPLGRQPAGPQGASPTRHVSDPTGILSSARHGGDDRRRRSDPGRRSVRHCGDQSFAVPSRSGPTSAPAISPRPAGASCRDHSGTAAPAAVPSPGTNDDQPAVAWVNVIGQPITPSAGRRGRAPGTPALPPVPSQRLREGATRLRLAAWSPLDTTMPGGAYR